jgi:peptide/nickel transport system substrate-binding protein
MPVQDSGVRDGSSATAPRGTVVLGWAREWVHLSPRFRGADLAGNEIDWILNSALTYYDMQGALHPMMAERIPTRENGDWDVRADGTMVTSFKLRDSVRWHDGARLTAHDFAFAYQVYTDPAVESHQTRVHSLMSAVEATDDRTVAITWSQPWVQANALGLDLPPLPRHQLEEKYRTDKANFASGEEWASGYLGSGPFRLERWDRGAGVVARANVDWVRGPPRIETLQIRFVPDPNTLLVNVLGGEVDYAAFPAIRVADAMVARTQWAATGEGYVKPWEKRLKFLEFQYRQVPNWQREVTDARVRKALIHAVDRPALADALTQGLGGVADAWVLPSDPVFSEIDRAITKYPYDPQRAIALLAEVGWRGQAGGLLTNAGGETLDVEVSSGSSEPEIPTIIGANWKTVGVNATVFQLPVVRQRDREFRASFPGTSIGERTVTAEGFPQISALIPRPPAFLETNRGSFSDPEVDRLHRVATTSFSQTEQRQALIALNRRMSELAAWGPLFYSVDVLIARSRLKGPLGESPEQGGATWNIFEWEVVD